MNSYKKSITDWKKQRLAAKKMLTAEIKFYQSEIQHIKKKIAWCLTEFKQIDNDIKYAEKEIKNCGQDNQTGI